MQGDRLSLGDHLSLRVAERGREIHDVLDDLGASDPDDGIGHVVDNGIETALDDGKGDGIDFQAATPVSITTLPISSRHTPVSGGTTMVASNSSTIIGPGRGA